MNPQSGANPPADREPADRGSAESEAGRYPGELVYSLRSGYDFIRRNGLLRQLGLGLTALTFPLWARVYFRFRPGVRTFEFRGKT